MKLQDLQSPYRELAEMRREQQKDTLYAATWENRFNETNDFFYAFRWGETSDGYEFWAHVYSGHTPEIPESSLKELEDWRRSKEPIHELQPHPQQPTLIGGKTDTEWLYLFAGQAMQGVLANHTFEARQIVEALNNTDTGYVAKISATLSKDLLNRLKKEVENV